jgi:hypothetical protein
MKAFLTLALLSFCAVASDTTKVDDTTAQKNRIAALHRDLAPIVASLESSKSDVRVFIPFQPIVSAVAGLSALPAERRTVSLQSTRASGHFYDNKDLCNSYVALEGPGALHGSGVLTGFNGYPQEDGSLLLTAHTETNGHLQAHWQYLGLRTRRGTCPPGGGDGGSTGVNFEKGLDFGVRIGFAMAPDGQTVAYQATLLNPRRVDIRMNVGIEHIGNLGVPVSFGVPGGTIGSGKFPLMITGGGSFAVPGAQGARSYSVTLKPASFAATKAGVAMEWNSTIDYGK